MKRKLIWLTGGLILVLVLLQFFNPSRTNPPVKTDMIATLHPPAAVADALVASCYDCHSYQTRWPWYSHIAPVSWLIASDVNNGRENLNLSEWPADETKRATRRLENMSEKISNNQMPPAKYTLIHANARLSEGQRKILTDWLDSEADSLKSPGK